ncbi:MAG: inositol monophosphatase [Cyclobacteriaceae bacterium]|nr:inositol monophosphatase [Cyclobacteriaceae bacterium]
MVTEYDFRAEEAIRKMIADKYPDHNLLGEERGFENKNSRYTWIIDPLDGTSNFAAGIPWFGILIALVDGSEAILGGAYLPITDEMYLAEKGKGATKNGIKINCTPETELRNLLFCYSLDYSPDIAFTESEVQIIKVLVNNCRNLRVTNSCLDFCLVAEGKLGIAVNQNMKIWDIAAPLILMEEAGVRVTDIHGKRIDLSPSDRILNTNYPSIAANPVVHAKVMGLIGG